MRRRAALARAASQTVPSERAEPWFVVARCACCRRWCFPGDRRLTTRCQSPSCIASKGDILFEWTQRCVFGPAGLLYHVNGLYPSRF
jgi:hypothetical protein